MKSKMVLSPGPANRDGVVELGLADAFEESGDDWWYLDQLPEGKGYTFRSSKYNQYLIGFSRYGPDAAEKPTFCGISTDSRIYSAFPNANVFTIEAGTGMRASQFRLYCKEANKAIRADGWKSSDMTLDDGRVAHGMIGYTVDLQPSDSRADNQYFSFVLEDLEFTGIDYELKHNNLVAATPIFLSSQTVTNHSSDAQKQTVTLTYRVEESRHWDNELGFMLGVESKGKIGIPLVLEGELTVKAEVYYNHSWGKSETTSKEASSSVEINVGPKKSYKGTASAIEAKLNVSYVANWVSKASKVPVRSAAPTEVSRRMISPRLTTRFRTLNQKEEARGSSILHPTSSRFILPQTAKSSSMLPLVQILRSVQCLALLSTTLLHRPPCLQHLRLRPHSRLYLLHLHLHRCTLQLSLSALTVFLASVHV